MGNVKEKFLQKILMLMLYMKFAIKYSNFHQKIKKKYMTLKIICLYENILYISRGGFYTIFDIFKAFIILSLFNIY